MTPDQFLPIAELLPDALLLLRGDGTVLAANPPVREVTGLDPARIVGGNLHAFVSDPEALAEYLRSCSRSRERLKGSLTLTEGRTLCEGGLVRPAGDDGPALILLRLLPRSEALRQFVALNQKIAELTAEIEHRKALEQSLRASEARKATILEASLDGVIILDEQGKIVEFNPAAERILGFRAEEVIGREMGERIIPPEHREPHRRGIARYLETGEGPILGSRIEMPALRGDGTTIPLELAVLATTDEHGRTLFVGFFRDISRKKAAEETLAQHLRLTAFGRDVALALSQSEPIDEMLQQCAELLVHYLGGAFARVWLLEEGEAELRLVASAGCYTHLDGEHSRIPVGRYKIGTIAETQKPHLTNAVVGDDRVHDQEWARREGMVAFAGYPLVVDRRTVGVMAMFARAPLPEGVLLAMESVANAVALGIKRKQIEAALRRQARALQLAHRRKDEFLAMLAHELRNPLAPLRSGLELLHLESGASANVTLMREQLDHLVRLVDDLLDVSRIVRGKITLRRERLELHAVLRRAVESARPLMDERGHHFALAIPPQEFWVEGDTVRLTQVVANLLNNAAKYTPDRGHVWLEARGEGREVAVAVRDDGQGIDPDLLPDVFELFTQGSRGTDRSEGGLGIGLTVVRTLVGMHGGTIHVSSTGRGKGSEFVVRLPLVAPPQARRPASLPPAPASVRPCRVLVVDDNEAAAVLLQQLLARQWGHEVRVAHTGRAALEAARAFQPQVVFLDIGLPGMDGYAVARQLRKDPATSDTVLVALTGYGQADDRRTASEAGFDIHIVKPPESERLGAVFAHPRLGSRPPRETTARPEPQQPERPPRDRPAVQPAEPGGDPAPSDEVRRLRRLESHFLTFLGEMAHALGNLVFPLHLASRLASAEGGRPDRVKELTETTSAEAMRLLQGLRKVTRALRERLTPREEAIDLAASVERAITGTRPVFEEHRHQLEVSFPGERPLGVTGDPDLLAEAFEHLLLNAAHYTEPGGRILVTGGREPAGPTVRIRDTGVGMTPALLQTAFEPFTRAAEAVDLEAGRFGVGLAFVRRVIELHGGKVEARSDGPGTGTEVIVVLPPGR